MASTHSNHPPHGILQSDLKNDLPLVLSSTKNFLHTSKQSIIDGSGGAAVACFNAETTRKLASAFVNVDPYYVPNLSFSTYGPMELANTFLSTTGEEMSSFYACNSGSDGVETAMKVARLYFAIREPTRVRYIARDQSYHGNTFGALSLGNHKKRREPYENMLHRTWHHVSACNPYRDRNSGESDEDYCERKARELDEKFKAIGYKKVIAFVIEPVSGASLGCVPAVPGYIEAMERVCKKHGALLIFDEVMCGLGRSGSMHAWPSGVVPDIQIVGKTLGAGIVSIAGVSFKPHIIDRICQDYESLATGFTFQNHNLPCVIAKDVLLQIKDLLPNIKAMALVLERELHAQLEHHSNVGDIRGTGLFWGIEFVKDRKTKEPFDQSCNIAGRIHQEAIENHNVYTYPGTGCVDGVRGDHLIIAPKYDSEEEDIVEIVSRVATCVKEFFTRYHG